jgi:hypothetical protein
MDAECTIFGQNASMKQCFMYLVNIDIFSFIPIVSFGLINNLPSFFFIYTFAFSLPYYVCYFLALSLCPYI